ncbi:maleylpyruvate isomerase family mycothiol-dependent enzyme [Streptomyces sp. YS415]|uniref:maleylpyruvate isomerase family mycothiol-dependent enzyme n=1 Tax=Streptomyces sp. YS415 TaxID=2944806 RepID=UPI0020227726|nr:maleylpyruvate isomerase family mycothiol-dependent enzyme [Streptomyces sp. YS415]MCL7426557.1 maleylpyruvate isomerase family mycothiol-dependent enzyme [Streptomyces sp. YS415]
MPRTLDDARRWTRLGTELFLGAVGTGSDEPSALPGWSRAHLVAHVAANADALGNLVHWAATGDPTPMYASPEERAQGIERGRALPAAELAAWLRHSADALDKGMAALGEGEWRARVVTAQGRTVPAAEVPWLRAREVCVHAVDLATTVTFADLPDDFLLALCDDVVAKRSAAPGPAVTLRTPTAAWDLPGEGELRLVTGELADLAAYLTGRGTCPGAPVLGPWL